MKHLLTINCFAVALTTLLVSCGGTSMSGGSDTKKEKKTTTEDQEATDPQVVTGAYLACESSPSDKTSTQDAVGCNVMSNNRKVAATTQLNVKFYSEYQSKQSQPTQANSKSGYQALFINPKAQTAVTRFVGQMYSGSNMLKEISCDGSKLPCVAPVTAQELLELTVPQDGDLTLTDMGRDALKKDGCVLNPAHYCDSAGNIFSDTPYDHMSSSEKGNCMSDLQKIGTVIGSIMTGGSVDLASTFGAKPVVNSKPRLLTKGSSCTVKKQGAFLAKNSASGCYVTLIREGGTSRVLIMKKASVPDPDAFEKQLAQLVCQ